MADETASLIIAVNSTSAVAATANLDALSAAGARAETSAAALAATVARQNAAMGLGNTEVERAAQVLGRGAVAMKEVEVATAAASASVKGFTSNTRLMSEASTIVSDVLSGQFGRIRRSAAAMANASGAFGTAIKLLLSPLGLLTAGVGALAGAAALAEAGFQKFEHAAALTGNSTGYSAGQLRLFSEELGKATGEAWTAQAAVLKIASSGKFAGDAMKSAAEAAVTFSELTGESVEKAAQEIIKLRDNPLKAAAALNDTIHFLTVAEYEHIKALADSGDAADAAGVAIDRLNSVNKTRLAEMNADIGFTTWAFRGLKNSIEGAISSFGDWLTVSAGGGDTAMKLKAAQNKLADDQNPLRGGQIGGLVGLLSIQSDTAAVADLTKQLNAETAQITAKAKAQQDAASQIDALSKAKEHTAKFGSGDSKAARADQVEFELENSIRKMSLSEEKGYWTKRTQVANEGQDQYLQATSKLAALNKTKGAHSSHSRAATDPEANAYNSINKSIQEHIALLSEAADGTAKLDENQKFAAKVIEDLDLKTNKLNARDKERIRLALQTMLALDQEAEASKRTVKLKEEEARADDSVLKFQNRLAEHMASELNAIVSSNEARKKEQDLLKVTLYYQQMRADVELRFAGISKEATAARLQELSKLDAAEKASTATVVAGYDKQAQARASWQVGAANALAKFQEEASNIAGMVETAMTGAFQGAQDALLQFVNTGKLNFKAFAVSIIQDIEKIIIKLMVMRAVEAAMNMMGLDSQGSAFSSYTRMLSGSANGNAFSAGNIIPYANGGVVSSPTLFPMANGMGLMGEAGPEAVMPLKRGSNGKLGVVATGSGAGVGDVNITVMVDNGGNAKSKTSGADQAQGRAFAKLIESKVQEGIMQARRPGGQLWQMANGQ